MILLCRYHLTNFQNLLRIHQTMLLTLHFSIFHIINKILYLHCHIISFEWITFRLCCTVIPMDRIINDPIIIWNHNLSFRSNDFCISIHFSIDCTFGGCNASIFKIKLLSEIIIFTFYIFSLSFYLINFFLVNSQNKSKHIASNIIQCTTLFFIKQK